MTPVVRLSAVEVLALASGCVALGAWFKRRVPVLDRLSIPAPVAGGLALAAALLAMRDRVVNVDPDLMLRDIAMIAFFTTVGMAATWRVNPGTAASSKPSIPAGALLTHVVAIGLAMGVGSLLSAAIGRTARCCRHTWAQ